MLGLENEDNEVILGFLSTFPKSNNEKEYFKSIGKEIFKNYKKWENRGKPLFYSCIYSLTITL